MAQAKVQSFEPELTFLRLQQIKFSIYRIDVDRNW
jgi:hypothetical protein